MGFRNAWAFIPRDPVDALWPPASATHLRAAFSKQASLNRKRSILQYEGDLRDKVRIRSCGGPSAGRFFTSRAAGSDDVMAFDDGAATSAMRWRLGMHQFCRPQRRCKLCPAGKVGDAEDEMQQRAMRGECGLAMDSYGDRPPRLLPWCGFQSTP